MISSSYLKGKQDDTTSRRHKYLRYVWYQHQPNSPIKPTTSKHPHNSHLILPLPPRNPRLKTTNPQTQNPQHNRNTNPHNRRHHDMSRLTPPFQPRVQHPPRFRILNLIIQIHQSRPPDRIPRCLVLFVSAQLIRGCSEAENVRVEGLFGDEVAEEGLGFGVLVGEEELEGVEGFEGEGAGEGEGGGG